MKRLLLLSLFYVSLSALINAQVSTIADAKQQSTGTSITVTGIVTNGNELGDVIRYFQDETGGIAAYGSDVASLVPGDSVVITGTLKDYNGLLEIDPISEVNLISSDHAIPSPVELTPSQYSDTHEGMIVRTLNAIFTDEGTFSSGKNYPFNTRSEPGQIRITSSNSPYVGNVIPDDTVHITGILSEYNGNFQVLVREGFDIRSTKSVSFASAPEISNLSTTGFTLGWTTDSSSSTEAFVGNTSALELTPIKETETSTTHTLNITGGSASMVYYIQPFSVRGADTAFAPVSVYVTQSESTGDIKAYFTQTVDHSVSTGTNAAHVDFAIADTLLNYIGRATTSVDMAIYNVDTYENSKIITALNDAYSRGCDVRVVYDANTAHYGIADLNASIGRIASPVEDYPNYGIMHHKFVIIDAESTNESYVWTGSTNFTTHQMGRDANNVVILQDKSLAIAYTLEFNEMFGSATTTPNAGNSKFGPDKTDNTPHNFIIGGNDVELYFSPSDGTHREILNTINAAQTDIHCATMTLTKSDLASALVSRNDDGLTVKSLLDGMTEYDQVDMLAEGLKQNFKISGESGIMHHKYAIIDQASASNAKILTGSHNWTGSAQERNDENTLIIQSQSLANEFYQEFTERFNNGDYVFPLCTPDSVEMLEGESNVTIDVTANDLFSNEIVVEKVSGPTYGLAYATEENEIYYQPNNSFLNGLDTVWYKLYTTSNPDLACSTWVKIDVKRGGENSINQIEASMLKVYPNPSAGEMVIELPAESNGNVELYVYNTLGSEVFSNVFRSTESEIPVNISSLNNGVYLIKVSTENGKTYQNRIVLSK